LVLARVGIGLVFALLSVCRSLIRDYQLLCRTALPQLLLTPCTLGNTLALTVDVVRPNELKQLFRGIREFLASARKWNAHAEFPSRRAIYTSVPVWKPWRDF
jgi:hypothetical protein